MHNYYSVLLLRSLKKVFTLFINVFVTMYFMQVSDNNLTALGLYNLTYVFFIWLTYMVSNSVVKRGHRLLLIESGTLIQLLYLGLFLVFRQDIQSHTFIVGLVLGVSEGIYYSVYNVWESKGVPVSEQHKFSGMYGTIKSVINLVFPVISGFILDYLGFSVELMIIIVLSIAMIVSAFLYKDYDTDKYIKYDLVGAFMAIKSDSIMRLHVLSEFFSGMTYSSGAYELIITVYIIREMGSGVGVGIFTSLTYLLTCGLSYIFSKCNRGSSSYYFLVRLLVIFKYIGLVLMLAYPSVLSVSLFTMFKGLSYDTVSLAYSVNIFKLQDKYDSYREELLALWETVLMISRCLSFIIFIIGILVSEIALVILLSVCALLYYIFTLSAYKRLV